MIWLSQIATEMDDLVGQVFRWLGVANELTPAEREAEALDDCDLGTYYGADERAVELFKELRYSKERGAWVARFVPAQRGKTKLAYSDATYAEVLDFARILHESGVKPSQSYKALVAFDVRFDRASSTLTLLCGANEEGLPAS